MTSKHWTLVGGAVACLISLSVAGAPWLSPGDPRARFAAQKLADRGHMNRTVTTWPLMWRAVQEAMPSGVSGDQNAVGMAAAYLRFEREQLAKQGFRGEYRLYASSEVTGISGFDQSPPAQAGVAANVQWQGEHWAFGLKPGYAHNPGDGEELRLDGSYLAATAGNWVFGIGVIDRWWGPGWQSSLILSSNARPIPALWLNRASAFAPETRWLQWLGPWQLTAFAGQYESDRAVPDAKLIGMRFTFRPVSGLDIGLSRAIMFGGEGRPENASTLWNALIGRDNGQLAENDPGNQLGSIDARYGFAVGQQTMGLYAQMMGEDEAGAFPARKSWLFGVDITSQLFGHDQQWFAEYINTLADDFPGDAMPNITYDHSRYRTGYRYYGRSQGASFDGDAEAVTLGAYNFFDDGSNLRAKVTYASLNKDGGNRTVIKADEVFYTVPAREQNVAILNLGYGAELFNGWLNLNLQATDKKIEYLSGEKDQWSLGAEWTYRF